MKEEMWWHEDKIQDFTKKKHKALKQVFFICFRDGCKFSGEECKAFGNIYIPAPLIKSCVESCGNKLQG